MRLSNVLRYSRLNTHRKSRYRDSSIRGVSMAKTDGTVIQVSKTTRDRLRKLGRKGDTYDDVIRQLLDRAEGR